MSALDKLMVMFFIVTISFGMNVIFHDDITNKLEGYHCAPLKKFTSMEDAKKEIKRNQAIAGVK